MQQLLNLSKEESLNLLDLRKKELTQLCLEKPVLSAQCSRVALVLDYSGSMSSLYSSGQVQAIIERALPLAMQFDDNGEMEVWIFDDGFHRLEPITLDNYYGYIKENVSGKYRMGSTKYAPVMKDIAKKYMEEDPAALPNYVLFITDGDNDYDDKDDTDSTITSLSRYPIFFQFVGIGSASFKYLKKLDEMEGRYVDNANFFSINDLNTLSDKDLYDRILKEYPDWLSDEKVKEMIANAGKIQKVNDKSAKKGFFKSLFG